MDDTDEGGVRAGFGDGVIELVGDGEGFFGRKAVDEECGFERDGRGFGSVDESGWSVLFWHGSAHFL